MWVDACNQVEAVCERFKIGFFLGRSLRRQDRLGLSKALWVFVMSMDNSTFFFNHHLDSALDTNAELLR
jgi:nuclear transport factor 2 (NTF2) superfamily protein